METSGKPVTPEPKSAPLAAPPAGGWVLADERPRPTAVGEPSRSVPRLSMQEIDDGWVLPHEPERSAGERVDCAALDLNGAGFDELRALPGVGRLRARRIMSLRERVGRLTSIDDLLSVKGIGRKTLSLLDGRIKV